MANFVCVGDRNKMWKGGRRIGTNGYVLVRVPRDHHLRIKTGYAYEHRVVAEQKYGRKLEKGESVHHLDGNKTNNHPDNLVICRSEKHHRVYHRVTDNGLRRRLPDEPNVMIPCACGCDRWFWKYDEYDRPRTYSSKCRGHGEYSGNPKITRAIADSIRSSKGRITEIAKRFGVSRYIVSRIKHGLTWV